MGCWVVFHLIVFTVVVSRLCPCPVRLGECTQMKLSSDGKAGNKIGSQLAKFPLSGIRQWLSWSKQEEEESFLINPAGGEKGPTIALWPQRFYDFWWHGGGTGGIRFLLYQKYEGFFFSFSLKKNEKEIRWFTNHQPPSLPPSLQQLHPQ